MTMLLDINSLKENYQLLLAAKVDSRGKPKGLVADTRGELFHSTSAWGWWTRILGGLSGDEPLRIAIEKTYRALEAIPGMIQELGRSGNLDEKLGPLKVFTQTSIQIVSNDKHRIEPLIRFVQQIHHFWGSERAENQEVVAAAKKLERMTQWLPEAKLLQACQRIASDDVQQALDSYHKRHKAPKAQKTEAEAAEETVRLDLIASQESIIEEQLSLIEALKAQLAANSQTPAVTEALEEAPEPADDQLEEMQSALNSFEAAVRDEVKRLDQLISKIEERRGIVKETPPAPIAMAAKLGGKISGGSSRHDVIEQLALANQRLASLIHVAADWDPSIDPAQARITELETEIDRLSEALIKATKL